MRFDFFPSDYPSNQPVQVLGGGPNPWRPLSSRGLGCDMVCFPRIDMSPFDQPRTVSTSKSSDGSDTDRILDGLLMDCFLTRHAGVIGRSKEPCLSRGDLG